MSLYCPHCERPLDGHDDKACARKMSRRWFFGVCAGAGVAMAASVAAPAIVQLAEIRRLHFIALDNLPFAKAMGFCESENQNLIRMALGLPQADFWPPLNPTWTEVSQRHRLSHAERVLE